MEIWNFDSFETGYTDIFPPRPRSKSLAWLQSAAFRLRESAPIKAVRWQKAIRSLHAECDQLRRRMERAR